MKILIWISFALVVVAQWYVPLSLVTRSEAVLSDGEEFRFKTQPVDPSDPFRGKYITLDYEASDVIVPDTVNHIYDTDETVFAAIGVDSAGYAFVDSLYTERPVDLSHPILKVRVMYASVRTGDMSQFVRIIFPFERFYLEESKASEAEQVYWDSRRFNDSTATPTYALVRIADEHAVLVDVIVNDSSIVDIVRRMNREEP